MMEEIKIAELMEVFGKPIHGQGEFYNWSNFDLPLQFSAEVVLVLVIRNNLLEEVSWEYQDDKKLSTEEVLSLIQSQEDRNRICFNLDLLSVGRIVKVSKWGKSYGVLR